MELVYLWVEDYKNIKKQGFNFSPKFDCKFHDKYDDDDKLEKDCKLEIKPKEHLENFFDEKGNINITAIVGENGSGKSNILNLIFNEHIMTNLFFILKIRDDLKIYGINVNSNNTIKKTQLQSKTSFKCNNLHSGKLSNYKLTFYTPFLQDSFTDNKHTYIDKKINLSPASLLDDYKENQQIYKNISFQNLYSIYESNFIQNSIDMIKNCKNLILPFDIPTELTISVNIITDNEEFLPQYKFLKDKIKSEDSFYGYIEQRIIKNWFHNSFQNFYQHDSTLVKPILLQLKQGFSDNYSIDTLIEICPKETSYTGETYNIFLSDELENIKEFLNTIKQLCEVVTTNHLKLEIKNIPNNFILQYNKIIASCSSFLDFSWKPKLSSGQQTFLSQFSLFYKYLNNDDEIFLLIDEGDTTLHPNWQKKYIKYIIKNFQENFKQKKIHIIFSLHSPFILSDLPKENVIFLEVGEQKYPFKDKQTFGANIHTLLSDGFFMQDGLMGEFAKNKINDIINFYEKIEENEKHENELEKVQKKFEYKKEYEDKKKYFKYIQSIIGEDYLKQVIKNHIIEIEKILYEDKYIDSEIEKTKQKLKRLEAIKDAKN